jgi:hypothetical protein
VPPTTAGSRVSDKIATSDPFERFAIQGSLIVHAREFNRLRQLLMPEEGDNGPPSHVVWRETITLPLAGLPGWSPAAAATERGHGASGPAGRRRWAP